MQPIQSLMKSIGYAAQLKCDDFDRIKAYIVIKNDGNTYIIKRLKLGEINLDTLKKLGSMIENGQVWLKKGKKFEDKKFVGIDIQKRKIESIIVEKSDDKYGKRESRTINKDDIHLEDMSKDEAKEIAKKAEDLVDNVFEKNIKITHVNQLVKRAVIKEDVKTTIREDFSENKAIVKEKTIKRKKQEQILDEQANQKVRKKNRKLQKEAEEQDEKSLEIRKKSLKIEEKHEAILKNEIKKSRIK